MFPFQSDFQGRNFFFLGVQFSFNIESLQRGVEIFKVDYPGQFSAGDG